MPEEKPRKSAKVPKATESRHKLGAFALVDTEIVYKAAPSDDEENKFEYRYAVTMSPPKKIGDNGDFWFVTSTAKIERAPENTESNDEVVNSFTAEYVFGIRCENVAPERIENIAKRYVATTVWTAFTGLAATVTQQMRITFPQLPIRPSNIVVEARAESDDE